MNVMDVFNADGFSVTSLTNVINRFAHQPRMITRTGVFDEDGINTTTFAVEEDYSTNALIPATPRGGAATQNTVDRRKLRYLSIPRLAVEDTLTADEIQNVRDIGTGNLIQLQKVVNRKLKRMRDNLESTLEFHKVGAMQGIVLDADGTTELHNLFTEFGQTEATATAFAFGSTSGGDLREKCANVERTMQDALGDVPMTGVQAWCHRGFFDELIKNAEVRDAYDRWRSGEFKRQGYAFSGFEFGGIFWQEYRGKVGSQEFIPADTCRMYPVGVPDLFLTKYAPADFMETVNTEGSPFTVKMEPLPMDQGVKIHVQSNPIQICTRPEVLIKGTA